MRIIPLNSPIPFDLERHLREEHSMPCDTITTQTISAALSKALPNILIAALAVEGWETAGIVNGTLSARRGREIVTWGAGVGLQVTAPTKEIGEASIRALTVAYSKAAVTWAAARAGWQVRSTGENTMTIQRR